MILCKRIKDIRIDRDKKQSDIANLLQISQQYYSNYENGKNELPIRHLKTLCIYYNISADYFIGLIDQERPIR